MAAGDLALLMLLQAQDTASDVVVNMASTYMSAISSMEAATAGLDATLSSLTTSLNAVGDSAAASLSGADEALAGLSTEADTAAASFATLDEYLAQFTATDASTAESIAMTGASLAEVSTAADTAATSLATIGADSTGLTEVATATDIATTSFSEFLATTEAAMAEAAAATPEISALAESMATIGVEAPAAAAGMSEVAASSNEAAASADAANTASHGFGMGLGIAALAAGAASAEVVHMAGDFQAGMTSLVTGANEAESNIGMVSNSVLQMAQDTGTSTQQLTAGLYLIESAGFHGAEGLQVLQAAAEGARVQNADLGAVANGVTTIMVDYASQNITAAEATNALVATVSAGKTHMQDLAQAMATILPTASAVKVHLNDVMGAMATMTYAGVPAADAATYLRQTLMSLAAPAKAGATALTNIGLSAQQVAAEMKISLPATLQMIMDHLKATYKEGSPQYVEALKNIAGGAKQMQGILDLTGSNLKVFGDNVKNIAGAVKQGGNSITGWAQVQQDFNFKLDQAKEAVQTFAIKIGTALLPLLGPLISNITKGVTAFGNWVTSGHAVSDALTLTGKYAQIALPILAALGVIVASIVVPAFIAWAAAMIANPVGLIVIAVAALVAGLTALFVHLYQTNAGFKAFVDGIGPTFGRVMSAIGGFLHSVVLPVLQQIGGFLASVFMPVWQQLVSVWQSQILPALQQLWNALKQLQPIFMAIGGIILGAVVVAFGVLWGLLSGLVKALGGVLSGLATFIGGIVQFFSGLIQIVAGVLRFLYDLVTGNFKNLGNDLQGIWQGIVTMFTGVWNMIKGAFQAAIGFVVGLVTGFVQGVVGFFQHLADMIVGHSIIPDMLNAIKNVFQAAVSWLIGLVSGFVSGVINFFSNLWHGAVNIWNMLVANIRTILMSWIVGAIGLVTNFVSGLQQKWNSLIGIASGIFNTIKNTILGILQNLVGMVFQAGANIVQGIANGIKSAIGAIGDAMGAVGSFISSHLPHSPAKIGPLRDLLLQGQMISQQISEGIEKGKPRIAVALSTALTPSGAFALNGPTNTTPQSFNMTINLDGQTLTKAVGVRVAREIRIAGGVRNV